LNSRPAVYEVERHVQKSAHDDSEKEAEVRETASQSVATKSDALPPEKAPVDPSGQVSRTGLRDVEQALAGALEGAAAAGRWDVVAQLARELEARRLAGSVNVVPIGRARS
jgi:hypothetical protein